MEISKLKWAFILSLISVQALAGTELQLLKGRIVSSDWSQKPSFFSAGNATDDATEARDLVIQFKNSITEADKASLTQLGVKIFRYLPEDALIVRASDSMLSKYENAANPVNAILPFQADWKLSDNLPTLSVFSKMNVQGFLVTLFDASELAQVEQKIRRSSSRIKILSSEERYIMLAMPLGQSLELANLPGIEFIESSPVITPLNFDLKEDTSTKSVSVDAGDYSDLTGFETGTKILNLDAAWAAGFTGEDQIVAMADTGLDMGEATHVSNDFQGAIKSGYHFGAGATDWSDPMGHGTHVAGSVLGRGIISSGKIKGGAYGAMMVAQGLWSPIVDNLNVPPQLSKIFSPAFDDGARVHTNSWGAAANFGAYDAMAQKVDQFTWDHPDFLILFAAGNSGVDKDADGKIDPNSVGSPGTAKNCVTVGASKNYVLKGGIQKKISELKTSKDSWPAEPIWSSSLSENQNGMAMFSSRGPTKDQRIKPDVVAPGTNILSTRSHVKSSEALWGAYNDDYLWSGGTSMATPLAAGFAVVTREILMKKMGVKNPSSALIKAVMMHTAFDMYPGQFGEGSSTQELQHRPNSDEGYGRLDMEKVLALNESSQFIDNQVGVGTGEVFEKTINLTSQQSIMVNMVYTDSPGTPAAGKALVNNLSISILGPQGSVAEAKDDVNNAKYIETQELPAGTYKIQIKGLKVPMGKAGKQAFAMVYSVL